MRLLTTLAFAAGVLADWSVTNGDVSVVSTASTESHQFDAVDFIYFPAKATLELTYQTKNDGSGALAHQNVAQIRDPASGLSFSFPATSAKPSGKTKISIAHKAVPDALVQAEKLELALLVAGFGDSKPLRQVLSTHLAIEAAGAKPSAVRLAKLPEITHIFAAEPEHVDLPLAILFGSGIIGTFIIVLALWSATGDLSGLPAAVAASPVGHIGFLGSLAALQVVFFKYYLGTDIFTTLSSIGLILPVAIFSGSRALREVRDRRLRGEFK